MTNKPCPHKLLKKQMSGMQVWYVCDGWISVKVTPEPGIEVLTVDWVSNVYLLASWSDRDRRWYDDDGGECSPTHWRNLPSPPSENAGECGQKFKAQEWDGKVKIISKG